MNVEKLQTNFSRKGLVDFSEKHIFLTLKIYSIRPTIAHLLRIVKKFQPLPERCGIGQGKKFFEKKAFLGSTMAI